MSDTQPSAEPAGDLDDNTPAGAENTRKAETPDDRELLGNRLDAPASADADVPPSSRSQKDSVVDPAAGLGLNGPRENAGDLRDRAASARDAAAARADQAARQQDFAAEHRDQTILSSDRIWQAYAQQARSIAARDRRRSAEDRAAAAKDRADAAEDRRRAAIDDLTGAYRRNPGMQELGRDAEYAQRTGQPMTVAFLDVDGLKAINDDRGHTAGDAVLRAVADTIRAHLRRSDVLIRCGGDEFLISVLGVDENLVRARLTEIDNVLRAHNGASVSWGTAGVTATATVADTIARADRDLYLRRRKDREAESGHGSYCADTAVDTDGIERHRARGLLHVAGRRDTPPPAENRRIHNELIDSDVIDEILSDVHSVRPVFQPIVDLTDATVVGYEALARWPKFPSADPAAVFAAAAGRGVLTELDRACRNAALCAAGLGRPYTLFLNIEPGAKDLVSDQARRRIEHSAAHRDIVLELTERSLLSDPGSLLALVDQARRDGCRVALDDVGSHPDTLLLLDFVAPDIIKLDRALIQRDPTPADARVLGAILSHTEATGAVILAEGIEDDTHLARARSYGAALGQGWMFGRPAPLPKAPLPKTAAPFSRTPARLQTVTTGGFGTWCGPAESGMSVIGRVPAVPSEVFDYALPSIGRKPVIAALTQEIEERADCASESLTIHAAFQHARFFTPAVAERYARLAAAHPFVAVLGTGMTDEPAPGVHGTTLDPGEPLTSQWVITVVGHHYFAAVIARDLGDTAPEAERRFEFLYTHDRTIVVAVARSLMRRVSTTPVQ